MRSIYIAGCAVVTLVATAMMTDYTGMHISGEYSPRDFAVTSAARDRWNAKNPPA
jgi:hypothetical protein